MKLDLASGRRPAAGFDGVDRYPLPNVRYLCDLGEKPWVLEPTGHTEPVPFKLADNSCEALRSSHYIEHIFDLVGFMNECHRVLVPGGTLTVICPYQFSMGAWQDPTHVRAINEVTFSYFSLDWRIEHDVDYYLGITADFEVRSCVPSNINPLYLGWDRRELAEAIATRINVIHELTAVLVKR